MLRSTTYMLHSIVFALDRAADAMLRRRFNCSYNRALVLVSLLDRPGLSQHRLAETLGHTDPAVSSMLAALAKEGLISSRPSPDNKRKKRPELTPEGEALARELHSYLSGKFEEFLAAAGVDGERFAEMTGRLYAALSKTEE